MLIDFFMEVRRARVPASLREYLDLIDALQHRLAFADLEEFYYLARLCREGRTPLRQVRPGVRRLFQGYRESRRPDAATDPRGLAA
ncbi:hypothetical protein RE428_26730 [Marinobacter nanhaiticus D15-8W]|nr:hypothetical protein RE428_26730 [Marinobacter nanhaiticus D15-8W]